MVSPKLFEVVALATLSLCCLGCPSEHQPTVGSAAAPATVVEVVESSDEGALAAWAANPQNSNELRYAALRRLEELGSAQTVPVAADLAREADPFLKQNAIAVLVRVGSPEARAALDSLPPGDQELAAKLQEEEQ